MYYGAESREWQSTRIKQNKTKRNKAKKWKESGKNQNQIDLKKAEKKD